ncbi:carboxymuconolactone decarboxylase family protein [Nonomuraea wenchangensis]|uniref:Alkylhydroperoxidase family enzyme, contains CxxC motif n=1 Tax=Nonomuraea wenchangensis TaxID=568860 RepID=A0A1I0J0P7_9ACTN|nr:carboxymuconolactone decarboxylase family protein [Nonomuraea wenchangensis]SEU03312.1 Alkylhydroperoxidase family enzyme, contains CxxC motif [Nonomuraea wenchangensis]
MEPRVRPLPPEEWDAFIKANPYNVFATIARHPKLYRAWLGFGGVLLDGTLPARDRELAILRTAHHSRSAYEWAHHARLGREAGLTELEIDSVRHPDALWPVEDRLVLQVADDLHYGGDLTDATWAALCDRYDEAGRIELVMLVAHYRMLALVLRTLRVAIEE